MVTENSHGELSAVETALVERVGRGQWLDLAGGEAIDVPAMRSWRDPRTCRAAVIRDILRGTLAADPDPHGLRLRGVRIIGRLDLQNLATNVNLELIDCLLDEGVTAQDARLASVVLAGCLLENPAQPAVDAARLTCSVLLLLGAKVIGHADSGAVNLCGARIGGQFNCGGTDLRNDSGPALYADRLQVDQDMFLGDGFTATGTGSEGTIRLRGARVGGEFDCYGAQLRNDSGPALYADRLQVDQDMFLSGGFTATGSGDNGAIRVFGARIGGQLNCTGADLRNDTGPALYADGLQVDRGMFLTEGFIAAGGGEGVAVDLTNARVGGQLQFVPGGLAHDAAHRRLSADGLTYAGVPVSSDPHDWTDLLRHGTAGYAAQPYQQLAAGYRALGDDRQARGTLMRQRDDQLARGDPHLPERLWGKITKTTLGYGYQPWRALLFLAGVIVVSCVLAALLGAHGALAQTSMTATPGRQCTVIQKISVGLDLNLPMGTTVARPGCDLTKNAGSATAAWLSAVGWVLRVLAWAFAALFIAGFTSAVRKT